MSYASTRAPRAGPHRDDRFARRSNGRGSAARQPMSRQRLSPAGVADAIPISWVGDDREGERYRESLAARRGRASSGVGVRPGRTPICILAYRAGRRLPLPLRSGSRAPQRSWTKASALSSPRPKLSASPSAPPGDPRGARARPGDASSPGSSRRIRARSRRPRRRAGARGPTSSSSAKGEAEFVDLAVGQAPERQHVRIETRGRERSGDQAERRNPRRSGRGCRDGRSDRRRRHVRRRIPRRLAERRRPPRGGQSRRRRRPSHARRASARRGNGLSSCREAPGTSGVRRRMSARLRSWSATARASTGSPSILSVRR